MRVYIICEENRHDNNNNQKNGSVLFHFPNECASATTVAACRHKKQEESEKNGPNSWSQSLYDVRVRIRWQVFPSRSHVLSNLRSATENCKTRAAAPMWNYWAVYLMCIAQRRGNSLIDRYILWYVIFILLELIACVPSMRAREGKKHT